MLTELLGGAQKKHPALVGKWHALREPWPSASVELQEWKELAMRKDAFYITVTVMKRWLLTDELEMRRVGL
ncbi:unnamed protein product [Phytomonas sp. Hart1]|nr:unnamed protein product [Phytomonas sp. Hart1]|eukprot:CCW69823.1 unnamed protein product [Phytomonas sp. isolate Hart1]